MFKHRLAITGTLAAVALFLSLAVSGYAQTNYPAKSGMDKKATMPKTQTYEYLVISPHTPDQCLTVLDDVSALGKDVLAKYDWGCMYGDHTGYIKVQAANEEEALKVVPEAIRSQAHAYRVGKFTRDQIAMIHKNH
jgi:hypothetical protein